MAKDCFRRAEAIGPQLLADCSNLSREIVSYMQGNASWQHHTRAAVNGLESNVNLTGTGSVTISAFHTVPYGGNLEVGWYNVRTGRTNQPYPILRPALEAHYADARQIMNTIAGSG
jgi:hypothetical protein